MKSQLASPGLRPCNFITKGEGAWCQATHTLMNIIINNFIPVYKCLWGMTFDGHIPTFTKWDFTMHKNYSITCTLHMYVITIVTQYNVGYTYWFMIAILELMEVLSVCWYGTLT